MAIGIVNNKDFENESKKLNDKNTSISKVTVIDKPPSGRGIGNTEVNEKVRNFVAELGIEGYSNNELKDISGLSQSSISAYKNGATSTSTYNKSDNNIESHIIKVKGRISRKARKVALSALDNLLEPGRIAGAKTRDLAAIARTASAIIKEMEPQDKGINSLTDNRVQFIMMAPAMRKENSYDAIDVSAIDV